MPPVVLDDSFPPCPSCGQGKMKEEVRKDGGKDELVEERGHQTWCEEGGGRGEWWLGLLGIELV